MRRCEYTNIVYVLYRLQKSQERRQGCEYTNIVYVLYRKVSIEDKQNWCEYTNIVYVLYQQKQGWDTIIEVWVY